MTLPSQALTVAPPFSHMVEPSGSEC